MADQSTWWVAAPKKVKRSSDSVFTTVSIMYSELQPIKAIALIRNGSDFRVVCTLPRRLRTAYCVLKISSPGKKRGEDSGLFPRSALGHSEFNL